MLENAYKFLQNLQENNNREWFESHKKDYATAQQEWLDFVEKLIKAYHVLIPTDHLEPKKCVFRIYRDVRFSKNKLPFKNNFAALIGADGKQTKGHSWWYIHFSPEGSFLASGAYEPTPAQLAAIRQEIDYNSEKFRSIVNEPELVKHFGKLQGNQLRTAPKGYPKDHPDIEYLRYTQFYFSHSIPIDRFFKPDIPQYIVEKSALLLPFIQFLNEATE
jgi:uncharacterized protein (TIGR02453 family)